MIAHLHAQQPDTLTQVIYTHKEGNGLIAVVDIPAGTYIGECLCAQQALHAGRLSGSDDHDMDAFLSEESRTSMVSKFRGPIKPTLCVLQSYDDQMIRNVNLPVPVKPEKGKMKNEQLMQAVDDMHNACFIQVEDWAGWGLQTCRAVAKGEQILVHYGVRSAARVRQVWAEQNAKVPTVGHYS